MTTRGVFTYFSDMSERSHELFGFSKKQTSLFRHAETSTTNTGSNLLNYIDIFFHEHILERILHIPKVIKATLPPPPYKNQAQRRQVEYEVDYRDELFSGLLLLAATGSESAIFHAAGVSEILHRGDIMRLHQVPEPATMFFWEPA
jgi:hypothetical protein